MTTVTKESLRDAIAGLTAQISGPHHAHPLGEIDLILPQDRGATLFDAPPAGWSARPAAPTAPP